MLFEYWTSCSVKGEDALSRRLPGGGTEKYAPPDTLYWASPKTFTLLGRKDQAVQVGGVNVFPERVRSVLLQHPNVNACAVRLMRPEEGDRLKAYVVLRDESSDAHAMRKDILKWLKERLSPGEMPRTLAFGRRIPRNTLGKEMDW